MLDLPNRPTPNERALAGWTRERFTGLTGTTITLARPAIGDVELVSKNGAIVDPSTLTVSGTTITLGSAAIAGDVFVVLYVARSN